MVTEKLIELSLQYENQTGKAIKLDELLVLSEIVKHKQVKFADLSSTPNISPYRLLENFADSVRWQLQKVSAEKEKLSADTLRMLGGVRLWQ